MLLLTPGISWNWTWHCHRTRCGKWRTSRWPTWMQQLWNCDDCSWSRIW